MLSAAGSWKESFAPVGKSSRAAAARLETLRLVVRSLERALSKNGDRSCFTDSASAPGGLPASGRRASRETILNWGGG